MEHSQSFVPAIAAVDAERDPGRVRGPRDALLSPFLVLLLLLLVLHLGAAALGVVVRLAEGSAVLLGCDKSPGINTILRGECDSKG